MLKTIGKYYLNILISNKDIFRTVGSKTQIKLLTLSKRQEKANVYRKDINHRDITVHNFFRISYEGIRSQKRTNLFLKFIFYKTI